MMILDVFKHIKGTDHVVMGLPCFLRFVTYLVGAVGYQGKRGAHGQCARGRFQPLD